MRRTPGGIASALVGVVSALSGCQQGGGKPPNGNTPPPPKVETGSVSQAVTPPVPAPSEPDFTRSFNVMAWMQDASRQEPLGFARRIAKSAGGNWIVVAPKPLDLLKWQPNTNNGMPSMTVKEAIEAAQKSGTALSWEQRKGYTLLYFGPEKERARLQTQPPTEFVGLYLTADKGDTMVQALSDLCRITTKADPELFAPRNALLAARKQRKTEEKDQTATPYSPYTADVEVVDTEEDGTPQARALEFKVVDRLSRDDVMQRLADYFGGESRNAGNGKWEFARLTDPQKIAAKIAHLKEVIGEDAGAKMTGFSSYASRHGIGGGGDESEEPAVIPPLREETLAAFDSLAIFGKPAVPALTGYLDMATPSLAKAALEVLSEMRIPEAGAALIEFAHKLQHPQKGKMEALRGQLLSEGMRALSRDTSPQTTAFFTEIAHDEKASDEARKTARTLLLAAGNIAPFETSAAKELPPGEAEFALRNPPGGRVRPLSNTEVPPDAITPLATANGANGEIWAIFLSGRYGDSKDIWLARGRDGRWTEFLFTGQAFTRSRDYGENGQSKAGSCTLKVEGDKVVISPPNAAGVKEIERLQKAMQDPKLPPQKRGELAQKYSQLYQQNAGNLSRIITLSLAAVRKDTDGDGLPDLVETRLGLDPKKADTDGDGVPDGKDPNPLVAPNPSFPERARLLQMVFTAEFGGDPAHEPIVVVLEKSDRQEFHGARGRVLCITKADYLRRLPHLSALRVLQFGGPSEANATILQKDGPCLFNDDRTKAEVHFWQWRPEALISPSYRYYGRRGGGGENPMPTDRIARFEKHGDWKLVSIKPWKFDSAEHATAESAMHSRGSGFVD